MKMKMTRNENAKNINDKKNEKNHENRGTKNNHEKQITRKKTVTLHVLLLQTRHSHIETHDPHTHKKVKTHQHDLERK